MIKACACLPASCPPAPCPAVMPGTKVQEHGGSDKAMVWSCVDFADESQRMELFCIRFASAGAGVRGCRAALLPLAVEPVRRLRRRPQLCTS